YGTALGAVQGLPTAVMATLSDDTETPVPLDGNTDNWILLQPVDGRYDGTKAGTYVFAVPLVLPDENDEPYFTNPNNLQAEVTIVVAKGVPELTASWNGATIDVEAGLSLTYGDVGELTASTTDPDGVILYALGDDDLSVVDLADPTALAAQQAGTAVLTLAQEETPNYEAASIGIVVTVAPKAIHIVPTADQGKVYGTEEPAAYGYMLTEGDVLAFDDELTDIVSTASRATGENVGSYNIELAFEGTKADNYAVTFDLDNQGFTITPLEVTVVAAEKSKIYGTDDPELAYSFAPELIGDDTFSGQLEREKGENTGEYVITQGSLALTDNYQVNFQPGTLTI